MLENTDSLDPLEPLQVIPECRSESKLVDPQSKSHERIHTHITECLVAAATLPFSGNRKEQMVPRREHDVPPPVSPGKSA